MTSTRPYLLRALHEWMLDNNLTPQLVVDAAPANVQVPRQFVEDDRIILNVSTSAVRHLLLGNELIEFSARFSGKPFQVSVPISNVLAIIARENGAGMSFPPEDHEAPATQEDEPPPPDDLPPSTPSPGKRGHLKIIK